jgi:predicted transcriptional regulator
VVQIDLHHPQSKNILSEGFLFPSPSPPRKEYHPPRKEQSISSKDFIAKAKCFFIEITSQYIHILTMSDKEDSRKYGHVCPDELDGWERSIVDMSNKYSDIEKAYELLKKFVREKFEEPEDYDLVGYRIKQLSVWGMPQESQDEVKAGEVAMETDKSMRTEVHWDAIRLRKNVLERANTVVRKIRMQVYNTAMKPNELLAYAK